MAIGPWAFALWLVPDAALLFGGRRDGRIAPWAVPVYKAAHALPGPFALAAAAVAAAADPLLSAFGDEHVARAVWASAHGLVTLELAGRFPPEADLDAAWAAMVAAYASFAR